jgi:NAD(P)-dependent dehydrogenase (short-subunit alcohol dehydrogenase family)
MESITNEFYMKKIVITGASSGIGSCCANYFLNCGAQVALVGRDVEGMKLIAKQYSKNATIIKCDLTQDVQVYDLKSSIVELFGSIDILINCAGLKLDSDIEKTFPQDYDYSININLRSVFLLIKNLSKFFSPNGSIVNVSCLYGTRPMQGLISFCMGKAGLEAFTKSAAGEFASEGIRVNCVSCCPLFSNSLRYAQTHEGENMLMEEKMKKNVPLGRMAYPSEPAKTIVFLCSKRASSITGQIIKVDGGRNLTSSGYVHYKGYRNMNSRFEPDDENIWKKYDIFNIFTKKDNDKIEVVEKMSEDELDKFILNKIKESNFSVNLNNDNENEENQSNNDNGNDNPEDKNNEENENEENEDENENEEKDNDDENNDNENNDDNDNDNDNDNEDNNNDDDDNNNNNYL